jgi:hypothetical protein
MFHFTQRRMEVSNPESSEALTERILRIVLNMLDSRVFKQMSVTVQ